MAATTEAEMLAALTLVSNSDSDDDVGGGPIVASNATEQSVNLVRLQEGIPRYLWRRSIMFLTIREQAVSVRGVSRFSRECSDVYMENFWSKPIVCLPQDARSLARAMEMCQYLMEQEEYVVGTTVVVALGSGVYEVVGDVSYTVLSVPFDNLSFIGQGEGETIIHGSFVVENGKKISFKGLTMKNPIGRGLVASGVGTEIYLQNVTIEKCQNNGVRAICGANVVAMDCQFRQNGWHGVYVDGSTTTARLINCTSHHNKHDGVFAYSGAVVDLMGERTSVHDNEGNGLSCSRGTTINVYQPCVLNDMSHENKGQNISRANGSTVQQKD